MSSPATGWVSLPLREVASGFQYGLSLRGSEQGAWPILRMTNITEGSVHARALQYVDLDARALDQFRLHRGDLLFNRTNSAALVGRTGLFDLEGTFVFASYLIRLSPDRSRVNPEFL